ncbi:hypothetical protein CN404_24510 [Bacillus thuringiensis]|uniref:hypothetical protein n=1 Tax=Bacillus thuringiensis TaxID=1428 RepID=UPI000BF9192E|nr:hypothetical protein [Bacillus thuringiensis]PFB51625.1 hypothetical protein CN404_24510 [Bacillus thuringiensis]
MKYKDRKNAKRKYKQALLATVATMTLGVGLWQPKTKYGTICKYIPIQKGYVKKSLFDTYPFY